MSGTYKLSKAQKERVQDWYKEFRRCMIKITRTSKCYMVSFYSGGDEVTAHGFEIDLVRVPFSGLGWGPAEKRAELALEAVNEYVEQLKKEDEN